MNKERRQMPNGRREADGYNEKWCKEKHDTLDSHIDKLETHLWSILVMLLINFGGIIGVLLTVLWTAKA